jgi:uncharacterized membrane protein YraQ (UPF0718 family)
MIIINYLREYFFTFVAIFSELAPWLLIGYILAGFIAFLLTPEQVKRHLSGTGIKPILKAVLFGVPLPLCSCGIIPVAASVKEEGASRGASGAFFIATPQTGIDSILVTWSMLGVWMAICRPIFAVLTGITGGYLIDRLCPEVVEVPKTIEKHSCCCCCHSHKQTETVKEKKSFINAIKKIFSYGLGKMIKSTTPSLLVGILLAALIEMIVPKDFGASYINNNMALEFFIMVLIAIPLYVCSSASVPVAMALLLKGFSPGAVLIFLVVGPATNTVSIAAMRSLIGNKATIISMAVIAFWGFVAGVVVNLCGIEIPQVEIFEHVHSSECCGGTGYLKIFATIIMALLMLYAVFAKVVRKFAKS